MQYIAKLFFTFIILFTSSHEVFAFRVAPFKLYLSSSGDTSRGSINIDNNTDTTKAINVYILRRDMDEDAKEVNDEIDDEFSVYPAQIILRPHEKQDVRIQYLGNPNILYEHAYRLVAEELPLDFVQHEVDEEYKDKANGGIGIVLTYNAALYVTPTRGKNKSNLVLHSYEYDTEENSINLVLENSGDKHVVLKDTMLQLHEKGRQQQWPEEGAQYIGSINMLANRKVNLKVPLGEEKFDNVELKLTP